MAIVAPDLRLSRRHFGDEVRAVVESKPFIETLQQVEKKVNPSHPWNFEELVTADGQPKHYRKQPGVFQRLREALFGRKQPNPDRSIPTPPPPPTSPEGKGGPSVPDKAKDAAQSLGITVRDAVIADGGSHVVSTGVKLIAAAAVGAGVGGTAAETEELVEEKIERDKEKERAQADRDRENGQIAEADDDGPGLTIFGSIPESAEGRNAMLVYINSTYLTGTQKRKLFEMLERANSTLSLEDQERFMTSVTQYVHCEERVLHNG